MNIEDLTLKQINEIKAMTSSETSTNMLKKYIGKYVICRTRNEGLNVGYVKDLDETGVILTDARRAWYHRPADDSSWYEGVANNGLSENSKISEPVEKVIIEDYSLTICSEKAEKSLINAKSYEN